MRIGNEVTAGAKLGSEDDGMDASCRTGMFHPLSSEAKVSAYRSSGLSQ
jgi:hypothetical protein